MNNKCKISERIEKIKSENTNASIVRVNVLTVTL